jgi:excisionase family DNA binding protein
MAKRNRMRVHETIPRRLLNVREAALYLGLAADTIYKKSRLKQLPSVKMGRALRFDVAALNSFIERSHRPAWAKD